MGRLPTREMRRQTSPQPLGGQLGIGQPLGIQRTPQGRFADPCTDEHHVLPTVAIGTCELAADPRPIFVRSIRSAAGRPATTRRRGSSGCPAPCRDRAAVHASRRLRCDRSATSLHLHAIRRVESSVMRLAAPAPPACLSMAAGSLQEQPLESRSPSIKLHPCERAEPDYRAR